MYRFARATAAQYAPRPSKTDGIVSARIRRSRLIERFSMYSRSTDEPFLEAQAAAPEDLHRPGQPRLDREPEQVLGPVAAHELDLLRPRADEAHVALQHVQELGQLVEARPAEEATEPRHARVARRA